MSLRLADASLRWALEHALIHHDTDIFPEAFEFKAIEDSWPDIQAYIQDQDIQKWAVRPARRCLAPKHRFGFRVSTQLDPLDFLVFTALVFEVGNLFENQRVPAERNIVHSYRFSPADPGAMYSAEYTFRSFQDASRRACDELEPSHVVVADVADFFPRIYGHRIDNAIDSALGIGNLHGVALKALLSHFAGTYSYGIPVGSAASRLIAELTISDVDQLLLSEGVRYVRFSDDFRIFCHSEGEAYSRLALLATTLFENHGLTLQQNKTRILKVDDFRRIYLHEEEHREVDNLSSRFYELLAEIGIEDFYGEIDFDSLPDEDKAKIRELNLHGILEEQLAEEEPDLALIKFLLKRFNQIAAIEPVEIIFRDIDKFSPVIRETIEFLINTKGLSADDRRGLGEQIVRVLETPATSVTSLEYTRMYLLRPFAEDSQWNSEQSYTRLYNAIPDDFARRELLLAMGRSGQDFWMRGRKQHLSTFSPWLRRAYIYAASCLPNDEYKHWIRGIQGQLDPLERAVSSWSRKNRICM